MSGLAERHVIEEGVLGALNGRCRFASGPRRTRQVLAEEHHRRRHQASASRPPGSPVDARPRRTRPDPRCCPDSAALSQASPARPSSLRLPPTSAHAAMGAVCDVAVDVYVRPSGPLLIALALADLSSWLLVLVAGGGSSCRRLPSGRRSLPVTSRPRRGGLPRRFGRGRGLASAWARCGDAGVC